MVVDSGPWVVPLADGETECLPGELAFLASCLRTPAFRSLDVVVRRPLSWLRMMLRILVVMDVFNWGF